ncbi:DUF1850 domain-containing protein [Phocicoccus pinnipedialis]|uniref:DUF1850 domain-containing protein n=1 Tax=Phocicoccus pinnipedialis TaxID=110845 RepID=A0A6V7RIF9_9BACL|nr:DUF1850 domain-containing protein [Jeotgalicoccus pinnipedialis]MBP1939070.1 hypothetical protein [Jeotgalicoccus pinnipedialis]CAD2076931.1 hypothetical protein JEOPIN946_01368 [Jeotgalicoccus pinnipedialis]
MLLFLILKRVEYIKISGEDGHVENIYTDTFEIHWIHSVEKEEWYETYEIRENKLFITKSSFKTYGAGVPTDVKYKSKINDDGFVELTINQFRESLLLTVSSNVETTIHYETIDLKLYEIYENYSSVEVSVESIPLILYLFRI